MAPVISKEEAGAHLPDLLARAWAGEEIVIEQSGAPKLRLVPVEERGKQPRQGGTLGPISDEEAEEAVRPLPRVYWGDIGDDD